MITEKGKGILDVQDRSTGKEGVGSSRNRPEFLTFPDQIGAAAKCVSCWWLLPLLWAWKEFASQELNVILFQLCTTCSKVLSVSLSCNSYRTRPLIFSFFLVGISSTAKEARDGKQDFCKDFFAIFCIFFPRNDLHNKTRNYLSGLLLNYTYTHKHVSESKEM